MKKTVSWSSETLSRDREIDRALALASQTSETLPSTSSEKRKQKSKSVSVAMVKEKQLTSPKVNSRIQQMIAMQKAQNATMQQLMSTGCGGVGSASPSGLRDLVKAPPVSPPKSVKGVAESSLGDVVASENDVHEKYRNGNANPLPKLSELHQMGGSAVSENIHPMKPRSRYEIERELTSDEGEGIHIQGTAKTSNTFKSHSPAVLQTREPCSSSYSHAESDLSQTTLNTTTATPTRLNYNQRTSNLYSDSSSCDSPVSYNSVLDQNSTPMTVRDRKRMQKQLQTIQSQEQMTQDQLAHAQHSTYLDNMHGKGDIQQSLRIEQYPPTECQEFNWENVAVSHLPNKRQPEYYQYGATDATHSNDSNVKRNTDDYFDANYQLPQSRSNFTPRIDTVATESERLISSLNYNSPSGENHDSLPAKSHTQHLFHYGGRDGANKLPASVDVHSDYDNYAVDQSYQHRFQQRINRRRSVWWNIFCYPFICLSFSDQLRRSFCFGAIDGMLTGAGILSACIGLGLLPHRASFHDFPSSSTDESMHTEWVLIALTLAACFSDGICMAVGHVWSTRLVAGANYEERKEELRHFETCRSDAKARLVDSLLSRGMLKIDAMSLADTLEGYPDMFVSALLGEGFCGQGSNVGMGGLGSGGGGSGSLGRISGSGAVVSSQKQTAPRYPVTNAWDIPPPSYGPGIIQHGLKYESYSDFSDYQQDPDLKALTETLSDSRMEGFFMMISFGSFSVIPILVYAFFPCALDYVLKSTADQSNITNHDRPPRNLVSVLVSVSVTTAIIFLLGAWKSRFYSSHWCVFGIETVGVFLLCIATAYLVGLACGVLINSHMN